MADNPIRGKVDGLINQIRVKFIGIGQELGISRGQTPSQRTQSFNGGTNRPSWFGRKFSNQMSSSNDFSVEDEYAAAVAAAAFAIASLESDISDQRKPTAAPETSLEKIESKKGDMATTLKEPGRMSKRFTDEAAAKDLSKPDRSDSTRADTDAMMPKKPIRFVPSIKRISTFPDKQLEESESMRTDSIKPKPVLPSPILPPPPPPPLILPPPPEPVFPENIRPTPGIQETEAEAWERAELAKIKQRYDKLNTTIVEWEDNKKKKARQKVESIEGELQLRRAKAIQKYQSEMERINQIVEGARAQAKDRQRNEELKVKEKANKFRATGQPPTRCLCF
ncbi:hypothetical protein Ancab_018734 [Ancistrocladus abbreviatus]